MSKYHHGDLRNALIDAAVVILNKQGVEALSLRAIARAVGVSQTAPYRHFGSRDDLIAAVAQDGFTRLAQALREAAKQAGSDARERVIQQGCAYALFALAHPGHFRVMFGDGIEDVKIRARSLTAGLVAFQELLSGIQLLQQQKVIRAGNPMHMAVPAWTMIHGFATLMVNRLLPLSDPPAKAIEAQVRRMNDVFIKGAGTPLAKKAKR